MKELSWGFLSHIQEGEFQPVTNTQAITEPSPNRAWFRAKAKVIVDYGRLYSAMTA